MINIILNFIIPFVLTAIFTFIAKKLKETGMKISEMANITGLSESHVKKIIKNKGTIDGVLKLVDKTDTTNTTISFDASGVKQGDALKAGDTTI